MTHDERLAVPKMLEWDEYDPVKRRYRLVPVGTHRATIDSDKVLESKTVYLRPRCKCGRLRRYL